MSESLNRTVSLMSYEGKLFEIDQLLDQRDPDVFHLYYMDGSEHGEHIGTDFNSVQEAKNYAKSWAKGERD